MSEAGDRKQAFISYATADRTTADAIWNLPLSLHLKPDEVQFVADTGRAAPRTDCLKAPSG